jgi:hypothetical protein
MCTLAALLHATWVRKDGDAKDARTKGLGDDVEAVKWATLAAEKVQCWYSNFIAYHGTST